MVITDTMGRAWRNGQTDAAVSCRSGGAAHNYAGVRDPYGNELARSPAVAVADEIAAAAGSQSKLTATPVAVVRGVRRVRRRSTASATAAAGRGTTTVYGSGPPALDTVAA